jgi:hypothetical protein
MPVANLPGDIWAGLGMSTGSDEVTCERRQPGNRR